jgi:hypothetical protein
VISCLATDVGQWTSCDPGHSQLERDRRLFNLEIDDAGRISIDIDTRSDEDEGQREREDAFLLIEA